MIEWPDGQIVAARSATEFLLTLAAEQWTPTGFQAMKDQLSARCMVLTGQFVDSESPDLKFLEKLARTGMFKLVEL